MPSTSPNAASPWQCAVQLLRALHTPEYRAAKAQEVGGFSVWATAITAFFVATIWVWDYAIDPRNMPNTFWLRMAEAAPVAALAFVMNRNPAGAAARIGLFVVPLWVQITFIEILDRLEGGPSYGIGGFLYFFLFVPFMAQAQTLRFNAALMATIALFPNLVALAGYADHLNLPVYNAYVWMVYPPVVMILALVDYLLYRIQQARELSAREAATDPLTGVANRRSFLRIAQQLMLWAGRSRAPVSLLYIDVDHFKAINDLHGHSFGDRVLRELADTAGALIRRSDVLARFGGEEFVILLPGADAPAARNLAEQLRQRAAELPLLTEAGKPVAVTISIGVATGRTIGNTEPNLRALLQSADAALYAAKRGGRNRVEQA